MGSTLVRTHLYIQAPGPDDLLKVEVYGLQRLNINTPSQTPAADLTQLCKGLNLADPDFANPRGVDMILGANIYNQVLLPGVAHLGTLLAQNTVFGWILTGAQERDEPTSPAQECRPLIPTTSTCVTMLESAEPWHEELIGLMQRFWTLEEIPTALRQSPDDIDCERIFVDQHRRDPRGRYSVPLPVKRGGLTLLGDSLANALGVLSSVQRRMRRNLVLKEEYMRFMQDYLLLGHMRPLTDQELAADCQAVNYLPHHGIWQQKDGGKKLRVVFNASCPTSTDRSLNDILHSGPKLQNDLASVVTRWRRWSVAFCADISMMFRQIKFNENFVNMQRIVWSPAEGEPTMHYALLTVTYGEACAPFLALRTLQQLCTDEGAAYPEAVDAVQRELYVDDFLSGADSVEAARHRRDQLIQLLKAGGFELKKWVSNTPHLLDDIPVEDRLRPSWWHFASEGPVNELGIAWNPVDDCFKFSPPTFDARPPTTKRRVLAEIARLFDPAGWLAPVVIVAKMFMQDLWRAKLCWDEELPASMSRRWTAFRSNLRNIADIELPRWLHWTSSSDAQLHAFADASRRAFAAVIYLRTLSNTGEVQVTLVSAKTKLASITSLTPMERPTTRMTIPRLELRAALLAAKLVRLASESLNVPLTHIHAWSDSQVVLRWLQSTGPIGNDFVDNCVAHIQETLPSRNWRYVPTGENPADVATRGTDAEGLRQSPLWWHGPPWVANPPNTWPGEAPKDLPSIACLSIQVMQCGLMERFSCLTRLLRIAARCRRLLLGRRENPTSPLSPIGTGELQQLFLTFVKFSQQRDFSNELTDLSHNRPPRTASALRSLDPFLDDSGIMRVGGRLVNSTLPYAERHPVILDANCHLAKLVIDWAHHRALHAGYRATQTYVMRRAWLVGGRARIKAHVRGCMVCAKATDRPMTQAMATLPATRVVPSRPFSRTGADYAGPFQVLKSKGRGVTASKGYVAVFVCMSSKAVHLELVGDLTTASLLGALTRFAGRRGKPNEIWSDNATNFRGADAELRRLLHKAELSWDQITSTLSADGIKWSFIPPTAPHFGGLWEAGVKSMKTHLRRVAGTRRLTYEEFATLLVEIEAVLNCRPIVPLTGEIDDLDVLTPAHFLVGGSLASIPEPNDPAVNLERLTHWDLVRGMRDHFWARWSREYLNTLQQRTKWTRRRENLPVGALVMIADPSLLKPNGRWPLGRVLQVYPGQDNLVRVARIKTAGGEYLRPVTKLVCLPLTPASTNDGALAKEGDPREPTV